MSEPTQETDALKDVVVLYHGCVRDLGHYLYTKSGYAPRTGENRDWDWRASRPSRFISNGLSYACKRKLPGIAPETEGVAKVTHLFCELGKDWTVLGFWDRSVDKRYNSWSMFIATGTHDFDTMVQLAKRDFPHVWNRYTFDVVQEPAPSTEKPT